MDEIAARLATFEWWQMCLLVLCVGMAIGEAMRR